MAQTSPFTATRSFESDREAASEPQDFNREKLTESLKEIWVRRTKQIGNELEELKYLA